MLVDRERRRVVDLLPERSDVACARWVRRHPAVRLISRDRGGDYAAGATLGAPQAEQIADRFQLLVTARMPVRSWTAVSPATTRACARRRIAVPRPMRFPARRKARRRTRVANRSGMRRVSSSTSRL
jgi:transposase